MSRKSKDFSTTAKPSKETCSITKTVNSNDAYTADLLQGIFASDKEDVLEASATAAKKSLSLSSLPLFLDQSLEKTCWKATAIEGSGVEGRLGPNDVVFDIVTNVGTLIVESDRLGIWRSMTVDMEEYDCRYGGLNSHSNFSSIRANSCVYKGKWLYELMLGSKGVMQLGWCTMQCKFSQEEGVGDTPNSYAYDGNRQRKWNVKTQKYGEGWLTGDVITCTIDCDDHTIAFYRNGKCLGDAFSSVKSGPGIAYFPAVSLSLQENLRANFGATPLRYPVKGFRPLQAPPLPSVLKTHQLLGYTKMLLNTMVTEELDTEMLMAGKWADDRPPPLTDVRSNNTSCLLVAAHIFDKLAPLLQSAYVVEACLLELLLTLNDKSVADREQPVISKLLHLFWCFMQDFEVKTCLDHLILSLLTAYRFSPVTPDFRYSKLYLRVTLAILQHKQTRRYLLQNIIFDKMKFPIFLHIKPPDDAGLAEITPVVWWEAQAKDDSDPPLPPIPGEKTLKKEYFTCCAQLQQKIEEVESIQVELLKVLMCHTDLMDGKTSRLIFIEKFRQFLKENCGGSRLNLNNCALPVMLCFFHRMVRALRYFWDNFQMEEPSRFVHSSEAFMPIQEFWSDSRDYFDFQRCGGSMSHLNKILGAEVNKAQGITITKDGKVITLTKTEVSADNTYPETEMPSGNSLMELLDGLMILYQIAAHKQLGKMGSLRDNMQEFVQSYRDTVSRTANCPPEMSDVKEELMRAQSVFLEKIAEQARQMSWVIAVIYSKPKQEDVAWVLGVALRTVEKVSAFKLLFQFMPEFYLEIVLNSYNALKNYFHPTTRTESLQDYEGLLRAYAVFLVKHFADSRVVITDARDNIVQALACFTCYQHSLKVLESLPCILRKNMISSLIAPYENRSWAQTNWILVRIWKGCGFGFRYTHLPNLVPSKFQLTEFGSASLQKPCPSKPLQQLLAELLEEEEELATRFMDTLLNQLNWSFSEFIGMMQEIQQVISRSEQRMLFEARQLKICATCFEISVCLFRVVEMLVTIAPQLFTDWSKPSAELLLNRLIQLVCQVLNRITMKGGMFDNVVSLYIAGLESVTHYPVLAVVAGILIQLILKTDQNSQDKTCKELLSDAGFQIKTLNFLLGDSSSATAESDDAKTILKGQPFDLRHYKEVSKEEIASLQEMIAFVKARQLSFVKEEPEVKDEDQCTICYSRPLSVLFKPCGHSSCRTCINHQMLSKKECFFCKAVITSVVDLGGDPVPLDKQSKAS